jgi:iron complex transport system substrate-binding protein
VFWGCTDGEEGASGSERALQQPRSLQPCTVLEESDASVTTVSGDGRTVVIDKSPDRVVVLMNSLLDLWYLSGGTAVGRVEGDTNVPEQAAEIQIVGHVANPVLERILKLEPQLAILSGTITNQLELLKPLAENGVQTIVIPYDTYDDFLRISELFIRLNGDEAARAAVDEVREGVERVVASVPADADHPTALVLFASMGAIMAESSKSHTGQMVQRLGGVNIAEAPALGGADMIPFSMELVVAGDPEVVLIVTMGDINAIKGMIARDVEKNEAWAGISAVRSGRVHYLPNYYFLYKPNERYPEAFAYLAKILYPGSF